MIIIYNDDNNDDNDDNDDNYDNDDEVYSAVSEIPSTCIKYIKDDRKSFQIPLSHQKIMCSPTGIKNF